jgi:hypothetical protein
LKKFNARHTTKDLWPITIGHHSIDAHALKELVSVEELADRVKCLKTEHTDFLAKLDRRIKAVERGPKHKAEDPAPVDPRSAKGKDPSRMKPKTALGLLPPRRDTNLVRRQKKPSPLNWIPTQRTLA